MAETLDAHPEIKEQFLDQWLVESGVHTAEYHKIIKDYLAKFTNNKELVLRLWLESHSEKSVRFTQTS